MNERRLVERHRSERIGWLRAAVLGANDGIVSTASLVLGVAAAGTEHRTILLTSVSGLIAGAMSMAAGEFVSVHSQQDTEQADLTQERSELKQDAPGEQRELAAIYVGRGLDAALADQVAAQLTAHDALGAHARDEPGLSDTTAARPVQAALASAASFAVGAALPIAVLALAPSAQLMASVAVSSVVFLAALGALSARVGGAPCSVPWPERSILHRRVLMNEPMNQLHAMGQSLWLDNINRTLLSSGTLQRYVAELAVTGVTSNPTIFAQAFATPAYDDSIR
jgi:VIT1/CCC1 family predicted Fe2+/Mn2+ transporter